VNETSSLERNFHGGRLGLTARIGALSALLFCEKLFLDQFVSAEGAQSAVGLGAFVHFVQHWTFRFLVAMLAALMVFAYVHAGERLRATAADVRASSIRIGWACAHFLLIVCLIPPSYLLYRTDGSLPFSALLALWLLLGLGALLCALLAMARWSQWLQAARALGMIWCYAAVTALLGVGAVQFSQELWGPLAGVTFDLVRHVLLPILPTLRADAASRILSTDRFAVQVTDVCSGLEGMGLILAFMAAWLLYFRREYIFPRALLLIPAGIAVIFALNVLRISALMLIGNLGFWEVASYGFHSQAGWIMFIAVACGLILLSRRSAWLNRTATHSKTSQAMDNPTAVYLMPLLAVLAAGSLSRAFSGSFEFFYPLRVLAGLLMLARYRRSLAAIDWRCSWRGPAVGTGVFLVWIVAAHFSLPHSAMPQKLAAVPAALRGFWIASRIAGAVLIVPIAEELAYRGYLMRRLIKADFESVPFGAIRWPALIATAIVFGFAHGVLWLPGIIAGLAYGLLLIRRGRLGEAVAAHAVSNGLIAICVLGGDQWQLW
jgi:exosortase E/protease (VPEID-CTERM system)